MPKRNPDQISPAAAARLLEAADRVKAAGARLETALEAISATTPSLFDPRELRIALDMVGVGHSALIALLVEKGTISGPEYLESLAESLELEAAEAEGDAATNEGD